MKTWRVIISPETDAYMNMAVDEALLQTYDYNKQMPVLRFYRWNIPAISIGISQRPLEALNMTSIRTGNVSFVRRMTGGEGIYHDAEITYSLVCSKADLALPDSVRKSFRAITNFILNAYREFGLKPYYAGDAHGYAHGKAASFCYSTKEHFDVMVEGKKIGGNAQKRKGDIIFQHGTIPLRLNFPAIKRCFQGELGDIENTITSLREACGMDINFDEGVKKLKSSFCKVFAIRELNSFLSEHETELAHKLAKEKYKTEDWNYFKRTSIMKKDGG